MHIFGKHVQTDHGLHTTDGLINLFDLVVNADGHTLKQIPFPAQFGACNAGGQTPCYVTAVPSRWRPPTRSSSPRPRRAPRLSANAAHHRHKASTAGVSADVNDARNQALDLGKLGFPIYYPKLLPAATGSWQPEYCSSATGNCDNPAEPSAAYDGSYPRRYVIHAPGGGVYPSYRMTVVLNSALGEFYGIQGTTWLHPPILNAKSSTENVNGKLLQIFKNGAHISLVAYRTSHGVYWVSNTLADELGNSQMIAIAASLTRAP